MYFRYLWSSCSCIPEMHRTIISCCHQYMPTITWIVKDSQNLTLQKKCKKTKSEGENLRILENLKSTTGHDSITILHRNTESKKVIHLPIWVTKFSSTCSRSKIMENKIPLHADWSQMFIFAIIHHTRNGVSVTT